MAVNIGPKIGIDGEKEFRSQLNNIIQQTKTLGSEMKALTSSFNDNTNAQEKNAAKTQVLNKQIQAQKNLVDQLSKGLNESSAKFGENDTRTLKWKQQLNNATVELNNLEKELKDVGKAQDEAGESSIRLGDLIKANVIGSAITSGINAVANAFGKLKDSVIDAGKSAISSFSDYQQLSGGIETLFKDSYQQVMKDASTAWKDVGLSANQYMEQVTSTAASLISSLNGDTEKATELSKLAIQDMADNANKLGTSMESIQYAYSGFAKQNYTMLDNLKLGYGGTETEMERLLKDAQELSGVQYDISNFSDIVQALHVIQTEMGITGTTAEEAEKTIAGSGAAAAAAWQNFLTSLVSGENIDGSMKDLASSLKTYLKNIQPAIKSLTKNALKFLPDFLSFGGDIIKTIGEGIIESLPQLAESAKTLFDSFVSFLKENLPSLISQGINAIGSLAEYLAQNSGSIIDAGITLINSLIDGITQGLPDLLAKVPTILASLVEGIVQNLPKILETGFNIIMSLIEGLFSARVNLLASIPQIISAIWDTITSINWLELGMNILKRIGEGLVSMKNSLKTAAETGLKGMLDFVQSLPAKFWEWGKDMISGLIDGIKSMIGAVGNVVSDVANTIASWLHFSRPEKGPLHYYEEWMPDFMTGLARGVDSTSWKVESAIARLADGMTIDIPQPEIPEVNSGGNFNGSINVNVYAAEGQDERELATNVADIINQRIQAKKGAFVG